MAKGLVVVVSTPSRAAGWLAGSMAKGVLETFDLF